jgi:hypothetical protein
MKKMYIEPKMEISKLAPMNVVCVSAGEGEGGTGGLGPGKHTGDAPRRKTPVF